MSISPLKSTESHDAASSRPLNSGATHSTSQPVGKVQGQEDTDSNSDLLKQLASLFDTKLNPL